MAEVFTVIGVGGHAKVVIDALLSSGCQIVAFYDDNASLIGQEPFPGIRVAGTTPSVEKDWEKGRLAIVAIGDNRIRRKISLRCKVDYGVAVAPSVVLGKGVVIGHGSMILPSATINIDSVVGRHAIVNTSSSIDHDCRIGDYAHVAPGCTLGGNVTVGEGSILGIGTRVIPGIQIGRWSVIGSGAVVTRDLPDNCTAVGVPARVIKTREEGWHLR